MWIENSVFSAYQLDIHRQKMNPDLNLTLYTKINLKCIMDLNVKQYDI